MNGSDIFVQDADKAWQVVGEGVRRKIMSYDASVMLVKVEFEQGAVGPPHHHPHIQCTLIERGVFDVTIAGRTARLGPGDTFIVPTNAIHGVVAVEAGALIDSFAPMREDFLT